jgi:signal transduction histidine kinase
MRAGQIRSGVAQGLPDTDDLQIAFVRIREEVCVAAQIVFRVLREGQPRALHALIRDEIYRIGREALLNAFRHSEARRVEVSIVYAPKGLRMAIRDDGKGISPEVFRAGGCHGGISRMRLLAQGIGGKLRLFTRAQAGTQVELSIPGHIAFASQNGASQWAYSRGWRA